MEIKEGMILMKNVVAKEDCPFSLYAGYSQNRTLKKHRTIE